MLKMIFFFLVMSSDCVKVWFSFMNENEHKGADDFPEARSNYESFEYNSEFYVFGGYGKSDNGSGYLNSMWKYTENGWSLVSGSRIVNKVGSDYSREFSSNTKIGTRMGSVVWTLFDIISDEVIIFGGYGYDYTKHAHDGECLGYLGDLISYDLSLDEYMFFSKNDDSKYCNQLTSYIESVSMGGRKFSFGWKKDSYLFLFGGLGCSDCSCDDIYLNDLFLLDVTERSDTNTVISFVSGSTSGNQYGNYSLMKGYPGGRFGGFTWTINNKAYLFGGEGYGETTMGVLGDLWECNYNDLSNISWRYLSGSKDANLEMEAGELMEFSNLFKPAGSRFQSGWRNEENNDLLFLFGGEDINGDLFNTIWAYSVNRSEWALFYGTSEMNVSSEYNKLDEFNEQNVLGGLPGSQTIYDPNEQKIHILMGYGKLNDGSWGYSQYSIHAKFLNECFGKSAADPDVCSGNECISENSCDCPYPFNETADCSYYTCFGVRYDNDSVCGGHGTCTSQDYCLCSEKWYASKNCDYYYCYGVEMYQENVCGGHGECVDINDCICEDGYVYDSTIGVDCSDFTCFGYGSNDDSVCSGNGNCSHFDHCECEDNYFDEDCSSFYCFGIPHDNASVCNGHGECIGFNECECEYPFDKMENCSDYTCFGIKYNNKSVCNGHGECLSFNECECEYPFNKMEDCSDYTCFGIKYNNKSVCSGIGECKETDICKCPENYIGDQCKEFACNGYSMNDKRVCNSRGDCIAPGECKCQFPYNETAFCEYFTCYGIRNDLKTQVCNGNGVCNSHDSCICNDGFIGNACKVVKCSNATCVHGECLENNTCMCLDEYWGDICNETSIKNQENTGIALFGFEGMEYIMIGSASLIVFLCIIFSVIITGVVCYCFTDNRREKKEERKLHSYVLGDEETDGEVPNFSISSKLMMINPLDVKLLMIIGSGGSETNVYKGEWNQQIVAIKMFKCYSSFGSEPDFKGFEDEMRILSSLGHPNIISFYGCIFQPGKKIGLVMEYCEHGDLRKYFYSHQNNNFFDFKNKMRIAMEMSGAILHMHENGVIHRDLKSDNVLLTKELISKIMDFGISKITMLNDNTGTYTKQIGTSIYMAPEVTRGEKYSKPVDIFSFSIILFELFTSNFTPYGDPHTVDNFSRIEFKVCHDASFRPKINDSFREQNPKICVLIEKMWRDKQDERPKTSDVFKILKQINKETSSENEEKEEKKSLFSINISKGEKELKDFLRDTKFDNI